MDAQVPGCPTNTLALCDNGVGRLAEVPLGAEPLRLHDSYPRVKLRQIGPGTGDAGRHG